MTSFTIYLHDDGALNALERASARLDNLQPVMAEIAEILLDSTDDRFKSAIAPDGSPWAPKSATTLDIYKRAGKPIRMRPLTGESGQLRNSINAHGGPDYVEIGSSAIKAAVLQLGAAKHQFKDVSPWGTIPARPFLGLSEADEHGIAEAFAAALNDALLSPVLR